MLFFKRYNYIILITFIFFLIGSISLFYLQYTSQYQSKISEIKSAFEKRMSYLETLRGVKDHIQGLKLVAESYLKTHPQLEQQSPLFFQIQQASHEYHLNEVKPPYSKEIITNVTGIGSLQNRTPDFYRELEMVFALNPSFQMTMNNVPNIAWIYYISENRFTSLYPWTSSNEAKFTDNFFSYDVYSSALPQHNPQRQAYWTKAYIDAVGKGMMVSCAVPIYENDKFLGIIGIDFTLDTLNEIISDFYQDSQLMITNASRQLLAHPSLVTSKDKEILTLKQAFPDALQDKLDSIYQSPEHEFIEFDNYLIMHGHLSFVPWSLFVLIPKQAVIYDVVNHIGWGFFLLLPSLLLIFIITHYLIRYDFVYPARCLIEHIEHENQGISVKTPSIPHSWKPWFETVSHIFSENRRLVEELKQNLLLLEEKVKERTHDIELKNQSLLLLNQEKNEFLGIVAHDLKNPLSGIRGLAEVMIEEADSLSATEISGYGQMVFNESERMFQLIANLLDVNAIESGKIKFCLEKINLTLIVNKLMFSYQKRAQEKEITLSTEFDINIGVFIYSDALLTAQVLDNLLSNAIKYSPRYKTVTLRLFTTASHVYCEFEDQGQGLSEAEQQKLFGKFSRLSTKPTAGEHSTGLGLFIVKKLVTALGGEVYCRSRLGEGSTFGVQFSVYNE